MFDQQKFQYKKSNLFTCIDPNIKYDYIGIDNNVGVDIKTVTGKTIQHCVGVYIKKIDNGSEFIGTITETPIVG